MREREIQYGKFSMKINSGDISRFGRFFRCSEISNLDLPSSIVYCSSPFVFVGGVFGEINSNIPTCIVRVNFRVPYIFQLRTLTKIIFAIVQSIMVSVVALFIRRTFKYFAVHQYRVLSSRDVKNMIPLDGLPRPLRKPFKILGINDSVLALRKRDKAVGFVKRLSDFVSNHTAFWHVLPPVGCVTQPPILTYQETA